MQIFSSSNSQKPIEYVFIDAGYMQKEIEKRIKRCFKSKLRFEDLDIHNMTNNFKRIFFYDCLPGKKKNETDKHHDERVKRKKQFFNNVSEYRGYHVFEGTVKGDGNKFRQKEIDVKIAVDMLTHTIRGNMSKLTLMTGDLDFKPVVDALVQEGMWVTIWCDPVNTSEELIHSADEVRKFSTASFYGALPEDVRKTCPLPTPQFGNFSAFENPTKTGRLSSGEKIEMNTKSGMTEIQIYIKSPEKVQKYAGPNSEFLLNWIEEQHNVEIHWN